jgi:AcrR family transcriptional regulator
MRSQSRSKKIARRDGRSLRAERLRLHRRQQILDCARRQFAEHGYHLTSVADIIARAGVARGTFYLHFPGKRAILDELIDGLLLRLNQTVRRIEVGPGAAPPIAQMRENVVGLVTILLEDADLTRILLRESGVDADFDHKREQFFRHLLARIERGIALGQEMGLVRACDRAIGAACTLGSLKEVMYRYTVAGETPPDQAALAGEVLDYVVSAMFRPLQFKKE